MILQQYAQQQKVQIRFGKKARIRFFDFAPGPEATWQGNFRDLNASPTLMATLATGERITRDGTEEEIQRLRSVWSPQSTQASATLY